MPAILSIPLRPLRDRNFLLPNPLDTASLRCLSTKLPLRSPEAIFLTLFLPEELRLGGRLFSGLHFRACGLHTFLGDPFLTWGV